MSDNRRTWKVEGVVRPEGPNKWGQNVSLVVYAATLEEVIPAVKERYPGFKFIKIMGDQWAADVIVLPAPEEPE